MRFTRRFSILVAIAVFTLNLAGGTARAAEVTTDEQLKWLEDNAQLEAKQMVPMRDGVHLATDIYLPKGKPGPFGTVFWRTPYNFSKLRGAVAMFARETVEHGYAFVIQNERGKFFSEGEWEILGHPRTDGYDALSWIADQGWSNGKVATMGCSSSAEWQLALAAMNHPAHTAMVPMSPGAGIGRVGEFWEQGNWYRGGTEQMFYLPWLYGVQNTQRPKLPEGLSHDDLVRLGKYFDLAPDMPDVDWKKAMRNLPVDEAMKDVDGPKGIYAQFMGRKPNDPAWFKGGLWQDNEDFGVPALWLFAWYDVSISPNLALFNHVTQKASDPEVRNNQFAIVAPTLHCAYFRTKSPATVGQREMGNIDFPYIDQIYAWLAYWLKGEDNGFTQKTPKVQYFAMGANAWRSATTWPPQSAKPLTLYLDSGGHANSLFGDGRLNRTAPTAEMVDHLISDPSVPVPSLGGGICCIGGAVEGGSFDQRNNEAREDVLVYTSAPLEEDLNVTGPVRVTLYVSSDARDTDFMVKLIDVYPDGRAFNIDETMQRARYRDGYDKEVFMEQGKVYELRVSSMSTSNVFLAGHRIRIEIAGSNFPRVARNMNTGGNNYDESEPVTAHNAVHHAPTYLSRVELSVIE